MKLPQPQAEQKTVFQEQQPDSAQPSSNQAEKSAAYSLAEVSAYAVPENCWSVVSGNVYDLTSWVARHPGGENPIKRMCGIDATSSFERKHSNSQNAKAALVLLKIGALK
jgi:cytochrome b involved in lipid metabolism